MLLAAYDWRLSFWNLEERDGYFTRLKNSVELMRYSFFFCFFLLGNPKLITFDNVISFYYFRKRQGKKVVLVAHSMGSSVSRFSVYPLNSLEYLYYLHLGHSGTKFILKSAP